MVPGFFLQAFHQVKGEQLVRIGSLRLSFCQIFHRLFLFPDLNLEFRVALRQLKYTEIEDCEK